MKGIWTHDDHQASLLVTVIQWLPYCYCVCIIIYCLSCDWVLSGLATFYYLFISASYFPQKIGWECPMCTYINLPVRPGCEMCSGPRPSSYKIPPNYDMTPEEVLLLENEQRLEKMTREVSVCFFIYKLSICSYCCRFVLSVCSLYFGLS